MATGQAAEGGELNISGPTRYTAGFAAKCEFFEVPYTSYHSTQLFLHNLALAQCFE